MKTSTRIRNINYPYFFVYCGAKLRPGTRQKGLDFRPWPSYYTTAFRDRNRPAAERSWAIVLYHINTTDRFGTHGNSGGKSAGKHLFPSGKGRKCLESAGNRYSQILWDHQAAGSSPVTRTKNPADLILNVRLAGFFYVNTSIDFLVCVYYNYIKYMSPEAECRSAQLPD